MHSTEMVQGIYRKLKIPIMIAPPYSWNLVAVEKWHSMFKTGELNPTGKAMTKKGFENVIQVAVNKAREIRRATIIMIWHHVTLELYRALDMRKL